MDVPQDLLRDLSPEDRDKTITWWATLEAEARAEFHPDFMSAAATSARRLACDPG